MRRLILGDRTVGSTAVSYADATTGRLSVITDDSGWVTMLRDDGVQAVEGDPTDDSLYPDTADTVVVAADDPEAHCRTAMIARDAFPEAMLISIRQSTLNDSYQQQLRAVADRLVDPAAEIAATVQYAAGGVGGTRIAALLSTLRSLSKPLAVVAHDNPDPDAIASAVALTTIAEWVGTESEAMYFGEVTHQENRALLNLLSLPITAADPETFDIETYGAVALVDHARAGVNDSLPPETPVQIVVDHHPQRQPIDARGAYLDIRPEIGSTSTIMTAYLQQLGITPDSPVATALLYGIQTDTDQFTREVADADYDAAAFLSATADESVLSRIESPTVSASVLETLATAITERSVRESALASCVGELTDRDALPQAADELLNMEGIETVIVFGYTEEMIYVSGRTRDSSVDLGETLRDAYGQVGSAGGHAQMAGAQVPMGVLDSIEEWETLSVVVHDTIADRFFEALDLAPDPATYHTPFPPE